jgi:hypothetical protein
VINTHSIRRYFRLSPGAVVTGIVLSLAVTAGAGQARVYNATRTRDGKPNFAGIWQALNEANWDIEGHAAAPGLVLALGAAGAVAPGLGVVEGGPLPYQPAAALQRKQNFEKRLTLDPEVKCYLPGVPRATYMPYPFQIIQTPKYILIVYTYNNAVRTIYMDDHKEAPFDSWMGWSNGRWEGETLVVDTTGFNDQTWFDRAGNFHSDALHVVERFTLDRKTLALRREYVATDPLYFVNEYVSGDTVLPADAPFAGDSCKELAYEYQPARN